MGRTSIAKETIVLNSQQLFWEENYNSISVEQICLAANIHKGTLYHFYKSKEAVCLAVIEKNSSDVFTMIEKEELLKLPGNERLLRYYQLVTKAHQQEARRTSHFPGCPFGKLGAEIGSTNPKLREAITDWFEKMDLFLAKAILDYNPNIQKARSLVLAKELTFLWQGTFVLAQIYNSTHPLKQGLELTKIFLNRLRDSKNE